ncbi:Uncharacterised protein [Citrobacter youngae]|uniref:Uncharacterized protein n=1 Tax=Citrobacter youngae TaxID=133448 RepID=A0ABN7GPV2_9ENTR|nr:hypothetical protein SK32_00665 [Citrobacter sp. MGH100]OUE79336.1 phage tail protein [Citrobacter freundii]OUE79343.1 phage tail protein [Citrobacter freundii]CAB5589149.1 Uncharacterised protein [Citrobacter youngae]CAC9137418.1 Uncharacterised protein [Citrobacter youngae]
MLFSHHFFRFRRWFRAIRRRTGAMTPPTTPERGLKSGDADFNILMFPKFGAFHMGGVLPELRGKSTRGWDDCRRVDSGRSISSVRMGNLMALSISARIQNDVLSITHLYAQPSDYKTLRDGFEGIYQNPFGISRTSSNDTTSFSISALVTIVNEQSVVGGLA